MIRSHIRAVSLNGFGVPMTSEVMISIVFLDGFAFLRVSCSRSSLMCDILSVITQSSYLLVRMTDGWCPKII